MKYGILISLFLMITNCVAMDVEVDWASKYKAYAKGRCEAFTGTEREMLKELADIAVQKENPQRYELVVQCLEKIYEYSYKAEKWYSFLGCSTQLLDPSNTFHLDFNLKAPLLKDIIRKIGYQVDDRPSEDDSDI